MKCCIPEISWHNRDPVLSIDIQPASKDGLIRLATGGTDSHVLMWSVTVAENGAGTVEFLSDLARHQRAVNTVRFSPDGEMLASGDDEAAIILWTLKPKSDIPDIFATSSSSSENENKENWTVLKILRGHIEDVYDLCWSPDSSQLFSGSVDNTAILWDVTKGKSQTIFSDHKGFVQGVAWDPKNQFVATLSSDRSCRVYSLKTKKCVQKIQQTQLKLADKDERSYKLFHDDTLKTFCRRLSFSPDGTILFTPCGLLELQSDAPAGPDSGEIVVKKERKINATFAFSRCTNFARPALYYPSADRYSIAVRCCPILFELRTTSVTNPSAYGLPYRMVFAVATQNAVLLYDTQQPAPFARIARIHYTRLTDLTWSSDGTILVVSSTDGYCSIVTFSSEELGRPYTGPSQSEVAQAEAEAVAAFSQPNLPPSIKTLLQGEILQDSVQQQSQSGNDTGPSEDFSLTYEDTHMTLDEEPSPQPSSRSSVVPPPVTCSQKSNPPSSVAMLSGGSPGLRSSPRRVQLITLSSPKQAKR